MKVPEVIVLSAVLILLSLFLGATLGYKIATLDFRAEAVRNGCAEYNSQTGEWQWKESK